MLIAPRGAVGAVWYEMYAPTGESTTTALPSPVNLNRLLVLDVAMIFHDEVGRIDTTTLHRHSEQEISVNTPQHNTKEHSNRGVFDVRAKNDTAHV